ncbi:MCE family protein [Nocardioidaceae bacterium]|nr:MCE family protein [Nocardioidaceae bacterium]
MAKPFRQRNPVTIGAISIAVLLALMITAFNANKLPLVGGGDVYYADFTEAGGLSSGDEVRVAGVRVGKVTGIELMGDRVRAEFRVDSSSGFGQQTGAEIRVKTLLGATFMMLTPEGSGELATDAVIPVTRTSSPYNIIEAFEGLAETSEAIDRDNLAESLTTLAQVTEDTPEEFRSALDGLSALSINVAKRDEELNALLNNLDEVSTVLANQGDNLITLMEEGDELFRALVRRREAINRLLVSTTQFSQELTILVRQSRADLKPALDNLDAVVRNLLENQGNLERTLRLMEPFYRVFGNTLGSGPWFDTIIQNFPLAVPSIEGTIGEILGRQNR